MKVFFFKNGEIIILFLLGERFFCIIIVSVLFIIFNSYRVFTVFMVFFYLRVKIEVGWLYSSSFFFNGGKRCLCLVVFLFSSFLVISFGLEESKFRNIFDDLFII